LTKPNQHVLQQIGLGKALAFGCSRSIVYAHQMTFSVVVVDGTSPWLEPFAHPAESRYALIKGPWLWQMPLTKPGTVVWDVVTL